MSGLPRQSAFLPTIKCSSCGLQIEISLMGEHVCGKGLSPEPPLPPANFDQFMPYNKSVRDKIGRVPPVDTTAANRTYYRTGQLTPVSNSSGSRSVSPRTPVGRTGAGRSDDFFAPKIANEYDSTPPQQSRRPGGYGGFPDGDDYDADPMYPASSPKKQAPSLLQRMNTIAPGPFEMTRKGSARNAFASRNNDMNSLDDDRSDTSRNPYSNDRPGTSMSSRSNGMGSVAPPRVPRKDGYGGFGPPQRQDDFEPQPFGASGRAGTFPRQSEAVEPPLRTPSAPGARPDRRRRPSNANDYGRMPRDGERSRRPSMVRDTSRPPPPRKSLIRPPTSGQDGSVSINLADEFGIGNPYHTPSDSMSSSASTFSRPSQSSSQSSPPRSIGSRSGRKPFNSSNMSSFDNLMSDLQSSMDESRSLPSAPPQPPPFNKPLSLRHRRQPPQSEPRYDLAVQGRDQTRPRSPLASPAWSDPAVQGSRRNFSAQPSSSSRFQSSPERRPASRGRDRAFQPVRGICKACGDPISGKSISSADGRLTGRYHKACFVCTTCSEPFSSATFYVHDDKPYCERHYHEVNGSLCNTCNDGIEGQYLADENDKKYHPRCFACDDCGVILSDGYFEVNSRKYCEKDASARLQPPPTISIGLPGRQSGGMRALGGLPARPGTGLSGGLITRPFGLPSGNRLAPGQSLTPRPRMEKRMTRLGMM